MTLFRLLVIAVLGLPFLAQGALVWETREIRLEAKANEHEVVAHYRFKNAGRAPVAIVDVVPNCDCTTIEVSARSYAPGEEGNLKAVLAVGMRPGLQDNTIAVMTDDSPGEPLVLRFVANIRSLVALSEETLSWRTGAELEEKSTQINAADSLRIASVDITGVYPRGVAEARMEIDGNGTAHRLCVRPTSTAKPQNLAIACSAKFADGTTQDFVVYGAIKK